MTYTIRQVIELTGASEFLLRGWENRYNAFSPKRTSTKRRLYNEEDVLKARALVQLTEQGLRVGQIAHLPLKSLQQMIDFHVPHADIRANPILPKIMNRAHQYDWRDVSSMLNRARERMGGVAWVNECIVPLLGQMARQSDSGHLSIAKERLLSAAIEQSLFIDNHKIKTRPKIRIAFAAPEGDFHDLGLKVAFFLAREMKLDGLFLGGHIPQRELAEICLKAKVTHLLLTSTANGTGHSKDFLNYIHFLDSHLPRKLIFWLAGRNAVAHNVSLKRKFAILKSFSEFEQELQKCLI